MLKFSSFLLFIFYFVSSYAQVSEAEPALDLVAEITGERIKNHLATIASDDFEGRETGTEGNNKAAQYIADRLAAAGIEPPADRSNHYQKVYFTHYSFEESALSIAGEPAKHLWTYYMPPDRTRDVDITAEEIYFLGYGINDKKYSDYKKVKNNKIKVAVIYLNEPMTEDGQALVTGEYGPSKWNGDLALKLKTAAEYGIEHLLVVDPNFNQTIGRWRQRILNGYLRLGTFNPKEGPTATFISPALAKTILDKQQKKVSKFLSKHIAGKAQKPVKIKAPLSFTQQINAATTESNNVLGYIEGTDLKDELVVLSAHYDHLGVRGDDVYNGADDNGSGTSTVLTIAETLGRAKQEGNGPRRSVLALFVTGEEKGLLGSRYYTDNPIFPLEQTVADVNVDMIGRVDKRHEDNPNYIYVIGADRISSELHAINEEQNTQHENLLFDYTYNEEDDPNRYYYRSDHYNFAKKGIPSIFFFSGVHKDYHRSTDTVEKILIDKTEKIAKHIFHLLWEISNREKALIRDK